MGNLLDAPKREKPDSQRSTLAGLECGACGMQGWRLEMEDTHIAAEIPSKPDHVFLAVFDGHGGGGASIWVAANMVAFLEKTDEWKQYLAGGVDNPTLVGQAMRTCFLDIDATLRAFQAAGGPGADTSGCTSVTCCVTPNHIICANAGDSRCVLATGGTFKEMSFDHKPYDEPERVRIEKAGGTVQFKRVDGDLAVSRALGDFQYKTSPQLPPEQQKVSPEPDIIIHERCAVDEFLLLACDGLWDVNLNDEASEYGRSLFNLGEGDMLLFSEEMIDMSLEKGSRDNISACAMKLQGAKISDGAGVVGLRDQRVKELRQRELAEGKTGHP